MFNEEIVHCADTLPTVWGIVDIGVAPSLLFYSYLPIAFVSIFLGFFIFLARGNDVSRNKNTLFFLITILFSFHILNEIVQWVATPAGIIYFSWSISLLLRLSILTTVLYFSYVFVKVGKVKPMVKIVATILCLPIILFLPTDLNVTAFDIVNCEAIDGPLWTYLYILQIAGILILFTFSINYLLRYLSTKNKQCLQAFYLLMSTSVFLAVFFGSEFLGDYTTTYEVNLVGPVGMLIFLTTISYIIVKFKAFNLKILGAQALIVGMWVLVASLIFVEKAFIPRVISFVTLFFTTIAGFFLVRSVKKEVEQREELELLTDRLEAANEKLKELDKAKSEFVSIASHQLRSPLTAIRGYASMLAEGSFGQLPVKAAESAKRIEDSAKLMAMSIEDYLNVSRIESGNMKYNLSDFNLVDMANHLCDDLRPEAMGRSLILLFRSNISGKGIVNADVGKTNQIIHNLINNSIKYTPKGSVSVFVHDDLKTKKIYIDIIDTGIGMSKETIDKLFGKFSRASNANTVNTSGTGLGLYVALKMAQQMGGNITCTSEGDSKGSTFSFELPLAM